MMFAERRLADLTAGLIDVPSAITVTDVTLDSRTAAPGGLFLACRGGAHHGFQFAKEAVAHGARAVLYEAAAADAVPLSALPPEIFVRAVPHLSRVASTIAARFFDAPSQALTVAGITGTNGKTTCAYLLAQALVLCGKPAAYMGTLGYGLPAALRASNLTTADAVTVQRQLAELRTLGAECVAMEVSSHALAQDRVAAVRFHTAVFTQLTRDHLDYHGTMARYAAAKARLFSWPSLAVRVINIDDPLGQELALQKQAGRLIVTTRKPVMPPRLDAASFVRAHAVRARSSGLTLDIESSWGACRLDVPLLGDFNADNVLTVLAVLLSWEVGLAAACDALAHAAAPPGRMELFGAGPLALVDFAHTPDALAQALHAARAHCRGRLWVVFGCGGDRDPGKRAVMGEIASRLADAVVLTDDNPRSENPEVIIRDIRSGIADARALVVEHDRAQAIRRTLARAARADLVLIAGKGHEDYQIYGSERRAFSDQAVVRAYFAGES
jgi:UDP-N-acetylmuramoyl-L-alanyl-D-glutamate--2,6-diaminopimelate ligase